MTTSSLVVATADSVCRRLCYRAENPCLSSDLAPGCVVRIKDLDIDAIGRALGLGVWERTILTRKRSMENPLLSRAEEPVIVAIAKANRLRWAEHVEGMSEEEHPWYILYAGIYRARKRERPLSTCGAYLKSCT